LAANLIAALRVDDVDAAIITDEDDAATGEMGVAQRGAGGSCTEPAAFDVQHVP